MHNMLLPSFLIVFLTLTPIFAQPKERPSKHRLIGSVRTIREEIATFIQQRGAWIETDKKLLSIGRYEQNGNTIESLFYGGELTPRSRWGYRDGYLISAESRDGKRWSYTRDREGHLISIEEYDATGAMIGQTTYHYEPLEKRTISYELDAKGHRTGKKTITIYDERERVVEVDSYDSKGGIESKRTYYYENDKLIKSKVSMGSGYSVNSRLSYDQNGRVVEKEQELLWANPKEYKERYEYDSRGNTVEVLHYRYGGNLIVGKTLYKYEYDSVGNWIKKTKLELDVNSEEEKYDPKEVVYRVIEYY
jgi:YD repeat-containing protein